MPPEECGVPKICAHPRWISKRKVPPPALASPWVGAYLENAPLLGPYPRSHQPLGDGWSGV